ncbi:MULTISPECIES: hypothetical protein [Klebsiella pneumoniae complex]|uniref:hypothetical protein n=1 Tax=Klebsiella pneumoniae complex TaxID=3390273 RepID=UPI000C7C2F1F|nr:hypothetical protein [Klebsiella pneumoniae]MRE62506.1 hypothetical protein [Klebsiella quasipneumoniae]PLE62468.1 hypothetical protein B6I76_30205 [Klebsiella pneumoniae]HBQ8756714.1 hypothetical protein [Klebsiella quasipneumoniae]
MKAFTIVLTALASFGATAGGFTSHCGPYTLVAKEGDVSIINGERVTSQKIKLFGEDGIKIDMGLMPAKDGNNYGFEYVRYPGTEKRFLNVQLLQASMDAPKVIGSFPCRKVSD